MNNKKIGALFVAFITLVVLYYILEHPAGDKKNKQLLPIVPGFDKGRAAAITISRPNHDTVKLKKQAQHWQVITEAGTFSAENSAITAMLDTVGSMQAASLVSRNPGNFASFDTDEDKGLKVIIIDNVGEKLAHFLIGKSGPDIFSTYVRSVKKNHVVLTNTILKNIFDKSLNEWRDKSVISLQPEGIIEYTVSGDKTLHLKRNHDNSWRVLAPNIVSPKQQNISAIITAFAALTAASISIDNETKSGITAPVRTITALTQDDLQTTLLIGKAKNAFQHYVKASGQDTLFVLENYNLDPLCPVLETISSNTTQSDNQTDDTPENLPQIHEDTK